MTTTFVGVPFPLRTCRVVVAWRPAARRSLLVPPYRSARIARTARHTKKYRMTRRAIFRTVRTKGGTPSAPPELEDRAADGYPVSLLQGVLRHGSLVHERAIGRSQVHEDVVVPVATNLSVPPAGTRVGQLHVG